MRFTISTFVVLVVLIGAYILYLKATYIEEEIETGSAYGFTVGDTKDAVYKNAKTLYADRKVFIRYPIESDGYGPIYEFTFSDVDYEKIKNDKKWEFYFDKMDSIRLIFEGEHLVLIHRHRQHFELP